MAQREYRTITADDVGKGMQRQRDKLDAITLEYRVPLYVHMRRNQNGGWYISRVRVNDEATLASPELYDDGGAKLDDPEFAEQMHALADGGSLEWPGWEFG